MLGKEGGRRREQERGEERARLASAGGPAATQGRDERTEPMKATKIHRAKTPRGTPAPVDCPTPVCGRWEAPGLRDLSWCFSALNCSREARSGHATSTASLRRHGQGTETRRGPRDVRRAPEGQPSNKASAQQIALG